MTERRAPPHAVPPPGLHLRALEGRAPLEAMASITLWPMLVGGARGDGHAVLVLPGMLADDASTAVLRAFLAQRGFEPAGWGLGRNLGPRPGVIEACLDRLARLQEGSGRRVSLVGQSLGGVYARLLSAMRPELVRVAISLGSPVGGSTSVTRARRVYESVSGRHAHDPARREWLRQPPAVPTTSIYSRSDGIVPWATSVLPEHPLAENIEVRTSHIGMAMHPAVLHAVADRLLQPEGAWRPFRHQGMRRWFYDAPRRPR